MRIEVRALTTRAAELEMRINARSERAQRALERMNRHVDRFRSRIERAQRSLQGFRRMGRSATLALGAMTAALGLGIRSAARYADEMEAVAQQTGISTESIQGLTFAAEQSNANLQLLATGLRGFVRRASEAARGNQQFLDGFADLGMTQEDVADGLHDIEGLFLEVADRMVDLETEAEASAVAMRIMSDAGRQLVPFMRRGGDGIREMMLRAKEMGGVLGELAVRELADFHDEIAAMRTQLVGVTRVLVAEFLPAARLIVSWIQDTARWFGDLDSEQRVQIVRWTAITGAVLGVVSVFGLLSLAAGVALKALSILGTVAMIALNPLMLGLFLAGAAAAVAVSRFDEIADWWKTTKFGQLARDALEDVRSVWADEDLELSDKVVETVKITVEAVTGLLESIAAWALGQTLTLAEMTVEFLGLDPDESALVQFLRDAEAVWDDEDLSFPRKVIDTLDLVVGDGALSEFLADVRGVWDEEELTFGQKAIETLRLIPGGDVLAAFLARVRLVWLREDLTFGQKAIETLRLIPGGGILADFIESIREKWADPETEVTLPEKVLDVAKVTVPILWGFTFARSFGLALAARAGLATAGVAGVAARGAAFFWTLGKVAVVGTILWALVPEDIREEVAEFWSDVAQAIRDFNIQTLDNPLIDRFADWLDDLGAEDWELAALTIGVSFAAFKAVQAGTILAAKMGAALAGNIGTIFLAGAKAVSLAAFAVVNAGAVLARMLGTAIIVALGPATVALGAIAITLALFTIDRENVLEAWDNAKQRMKAILADETLSLPELIIEVGRVIFEFGQEAFPDRPLPGMGEPARDFERQLEGQIQAPSPDELSLRPDLQRAADLGIHRLTPTDPGDIRQMVRDMAAAGDVAPELAEAIALVESDFRDMANVTEDAAGNIIRALGPLQVTDAALADLERLGIEFDMQTVEGRIQAGIDFLRVLTTTYRNQLENMIDRFEEIETISQAAMVRFLGIDPAARQLSPLHLGRLQRAREAGIPGFDVGGFTGWESPSTPVGVVHGRELVIPWPALRQGLAGVLEFLGVPGFQGGRGQGSLAQVPGVDPDIAGAIEQQEDMLAGVAEMFEGIAETIISGLLAIFGFLADTLVALAEWFLDEDQMEAFSNTVEGARKHLTDLGIALGLIPDPMAEWQRMVEQDVILMENRIAAMHRETEATQEAAEEASWFAQRLRQSAASLGEWAENLVRQIPGVDAAVDAFREANEEGSMATAAAAGATAFLAEILERVIPLGEFMAGMMQALEPAIQALEQPLRILGEVVGIVIAPILQALEAPLRWFGEVVIFVAMVVERVRQVFLELILGVVKFIDSIEIFGWNVIDLSQEVKNLENAIKDSEGRMEDLKDAQDRLRRGTDDLGDETEEAAREMARLNEQVRNAPIGFMLERFRAAALAGGGGEIGTVEAPGGRGSLTIQATIMADNPREQWRQLKRIAEEEQDAEDGTLVLNQAPEFS